MAYYRPASYIEKFAQESAKAFHWHTPEIHIKAIVATNAIIVNSGLASHEVLGNIQKSFNIYYNFLKVIGVKVLENLVRNKEEELVAVHRIPIECEMLADAFNEAWEYLIERLEKRLTPAHSAALTGMVSDLYEPVLVYCQRVCYIAVELDLCETLISEMHLYKEIEIFKQLKDDHD